MTESAGRLVVCPTPIGNLGDVTARVLDALREAAVIEAEDTRVTRKLLTHFGIGTPLEAYHAKNAEARAGGIAARIATGVVVALVSDAGMPGISDPGWHLVRACLDEGLHVEVLPGPSAIVTALVASGLPTHAFYFGGFLPRSKGDRRRVFESVAGLPATLVFYESPRRIAESLALAAESFPGREGAVARELTKRFEEVARGSLAELAEGFAAREQVKGEIVLLIGPAPRGTSMTPARSDEELRVAVDALVGSGLSRRDAVAQVAGETGMPRNDVYRAATAGKRSPRERAES
jgi:16S rRNA (cytidine1402-2'-O)-methyltransferase